MSRQAKKFHLVSIANQLGILCARDDFTVVELVQLIQVRLSEIHRDLETLLPHDAGIRTMRRGTVEDGLRFARLNAEAARRTPP